MYVEIELPKNSFVLGNLLRGYKRGGHDIEKYGPLSQGYYHYGGALDCRAPCDNPNLEQIISNLISPVWNRH